MSNLEEPFIVDELSLHGKMIKTVIEHWSAKALFEQYDHVLRESLKTILKDYLPTIKHEVVWDDSPELVDKCIVSADISFVDENGNNKVMNLNIIPTGTLIQ